MWDRRLDELLPQLTELAQLSLDATSLAPFRRTLRDWSLLALLDSAGVRTIGDLGRLTIPQLHALPQVGVQNGDDIVDLLTRIAHDLGDDGDASVRGLPVAESDWDLVGEQSETRFPLAVSSGGEDPSLVAPSSGMTVGHRFAYLDAIADVALDDPVLRGAQFELSDEVSHAWLRRTGAQTVADVLDLVPQDFLDLRDMGPTELVNLYAYLGRLSAAASGIRAALNQSAEVVPHSPSEAVSLRVDANLGLVAEWARMIGGADTWGSAMALRDEPVPTEVGVALQELLGMELPEVADISPITAFLEGDYRLAKILLGRVLREDPRTLQDLADELKVTRERVRQLESKGLHRLQEAFDSDPSWRPVRWAAERLQHRAGSMAPLETLAGALPSWTPDERRLISMLAGFECDASTLVRVGTAVPSVSDLPMLEGTTYVVDEFELMGQFESLGVLPNFADFVISSIRSVARVDGQLVVWRGSAVDKAIAVLEVRDEPQEVEKLVIAVSGDTSSRSTRNRIFEDPRVMRVTKTKVGLRRWGGSRYTTVADLMRDRLSGGPMDVDGLAEELAQRYEVSPASVRMYGSAPMFKVTGNTIALRSFRDPFVPRDQPWKVKGLYRDRSALITVWCLGVDTDMLRGSGRAVPQEIAVDLGIGPGARIDVRAKSGDIPISWSESSNQGPQIGSIRELVEATGAREGDQIALRFHRDTVFLELCPLANVDAGASPSEQIHGWTTLPLTLTSNLAALARTLEVEPEEVIGVLEARGDARIAAVARGLEPGAHASASELKPRPTERRLRLRTESATIDEPVQTPGGTSKDAAQIPGLVPDNRVMGAAQSPAQRRWRVESVEFDQAIGEALVRMRDVGYDPRALRRLVSAVGAHRATEMLVGLAKPSESFVALNRLGRLDLTLEAHVACEDFRRLFAAEVVDAAVERLADHDYSVDE